MKFIKFIIQTIKSIMTSSLLIIFIAMLLIFFQNHITNSDIKAIIEIISIALFGIYFIIEAYKDIAKHQYTTYIYIILTNLVVLLAFAFMCYLQYKHYDNIDSLIMKGSKIRWVSLIMTIAIFVKEYLKKEKYLNK